MRLAILFVFRPTPALPRIPKRHFHPHSGEFVEPNVEERCEVGSSIVGMGLQHSYVLRTCGGLYMPLDGPIPPEIMADYYA
jgi:hypothetical protein